LIHFNYFFIFFEASACGNSHEFSRLQLLQTEPIWQASAVSSGLRNSKYELPATTVKRAVFRNIFSKRVVRKRSEAQPVVKIVHF